MRPSACRYAASTSWRRAPSMPRIGPDKHARLRADIAGEEAFFGDIARFVKSDVLMRLRVSSGSPDGVMCFGSRDPQAFGPEQATELLFFLSKVLENTIRAWLDLPE